jgi:hypothetical protein
MKQIIKSSSRSHSITFGSLQAGSPAKKRQRATTNNFVAKPSHKATMNSEMQAGTA